MKNGKIGVGFIGCGYIAAKKHLPLTAGDRHCEIVSLYSRSRSRAEECQRLFGGLDTRVAASAEELLSDERVDLIIISTPNDTHAEYSIAALSSGHDVVCEKPMAINSADAENMLRCAEENHRFLHISYQNRFSKQAQFAKQMADSGALGEMYYARALALRRRALPNWGSCSTSAHQGGGPLIDIGSHALDLAMWLTGSYELDYVAGFTSDYIARRGSSANRWGSWETARVDVEDFAAGFVRMKNGVVINVEASYALNSSTEAEAAADVFGSDGGLELRRDGLTYIHELDGKIASERLFSGSGEPNEAEHEFIVHKLLAGDRSCEAANQALAVCKAVEALYASAASGKPVCF